MAKNKKPQHKQNFKPISPDRFLKEKVNTFPAGPCWAGPNSKRDGLWEAIATRVRPSGNLVYVRFRVDTYCRGVCSWKWDINISPDEVEKKVAPGLTAFQPCTLEDVTSLVNGGVSFAEEGGIRPAVGFKVISNILRQDSEEGNEEVKPRVWEYGREGRHCLIIGEQGTERKFIPLLNDSLGTDGYDIVELFPGKSDKETEDSNSAEPTDGAIDEKGDKSDGEPVSETHAESETEEDDDQQRGAPVIPVAAKTAANASSESGAVILPRVKPDIDDDEAYEWAENDGEGFTVEEYHYKAPAYPKKLVIRNKWLYDELVSEENRCSLSDELIDRILALPPDELEDDLGRIVLYEIGRTRRKLDLPSSDNPSIVHSVILLTHLGMDKSFPVVMELLRQGTGFLIHRVGSDFTDRLGSLLCHCGLDHVDEFEAFLMERGRQAAPRSVAIDALIAAASFFPERRKDIIEFFRGYIMKVMKGLRKCEYCDPAMAGYLIYALMQLRPEELLPEIQALLYTDKVATSISGDIEEIENEIMGGRPCSIDNFTSLRGAYPLRR